MNARTITAKLNQLFDNKDPLFQKFVNAGKDCSPIELRSKALAKAKKELDEAWSKLKFYGDQDPCYISETDDAYIEKENLTAEVKDLKSVHTKYAYCDWDKGWIEPTSNAVTIELASFKWYRRNEAQHLGNVIKSAVTKNELSYLKALLSQKSRKSANNHELASDLEDRLGI